MAVLLFIVLMSASARAQDWSAQARALRPPDTSAARNAVLDDLELRARAALDRIHRARTKTEAEALRGQLRRRLEESLGFRRLPWPPKLQASITGTIQRDGYRIEKIVFQTLPGTWVPAHLYLPQVESQAPAVLFYNGHWWPDSKSRPDFQAFCINMARMGFVVLSFDPFGQGERGVSSRDHRRTEALLAGISQQGIAEYETRCALEYLLSRKEVDPKRIGMTGASGGGYNTWITAALDDRISVVVPVVGTSDFYEQIHVTRDLDWYAAAEHCHFVPGLIQYANNHELVAAIAPRPLLIIAASVDQSFPITGVRAVHEYGKAIYGAFGAAPKVGFFEDSREGHGYQRAKREAAYGWFLKWLMNRGDGQPVQEPPTVTMPFDSAELKCFRDGMKQPAGPGIVNAVMRLVKDLPPSAGASAMDSPPGAGRLTVKLAQERIQRLIVNTQAGIDVPILVIRPDRREGAETGILVGADDRGKEELASDPLVLEAVKRGWMVWAIDPRGIGELATQRQGWVFAVSLLLGENFVWRQGWDLRRTMEAARLFGGRRIAVYARGHNAALAATYSLSMDGEAAPEWVVLRDGFISFKQFLERPQSMAASFRLLADDVREHRKTAFDREIPHEYFPFGALLSFDLPQLLARSRAKITVIDPIDGDWNHLNARAAQAMLPAAVQLTGSDEFLRSAW